MEKRSSKLPLFKEKVQSSCIWGLVDIFDFSKGRSNQKLLTNGRRTVQKDVSDIEHMRKVHEIVSCSEGFEVRTGSAMHNSGIFDENIKNLLKEEGTATLRKSKKQKEASKKQLKNSYFEFVNQLQDDHKKLKDQFRIQQWKDKFLLGPPEQSSGSSHEMLLDKHNLEAIFGDICSQIYEEKICGEDMQKVITPSGSNVLDQVNNLELLQITAKAFVDQIYNRNGGYKDGVCSKSNYYLDASEILNLNMDLFLKLLQDSNYMLLKNIPHLELPPLGRERMKLCLDSRPSECGSSVMRNNQDPEDSLKIQKRNSNNPFWKKLKDRYGCSSKGNTTCQASKKIVILKPGSKSKQNIEDVSCHCSSLQAHQSLRNRGQKSKSTNFSFKDIKRKFKQAVGENQQKQQLISMDEHLRRLARKKHLLKDIEKGSSLGSGKGKYDLPPDPRRREKQRELIYMTSSRPSGGTLSTSSSSKQRERDIFVEAKRHLSERLRKVDMGEIKQRKESPRTLKMVLSSPEHDFLIHHHSPKGDRSDSISAEMRFSPCNNIQMIKADNLQNEKGKEIDFPSPLKHREERPPYDCRRCDDQLEMSEFTLKISKSLGADPQMVQNIYSIKDDFEPSGSANIMNENDANDATSRQGTETTEQYEDNRYMDSSNLTIPSENHPLRPLLGSSGSLNIHKLEHVDTAKYKEEHASPVSVLEPFSPDDVSSPTSTIDKPDESSFQPRRIDFDNYSQVMSQEDPKSNRDVCIVEESLHLYVRAVMEASELSFNDIYQKGPSTQDVLYTCIADRMGSSCPAESYTELQLMFDCIHEVLLGLHECYFGCPPWLWFLRQRTRPVPPEKDVVDEVVKQVNFYLLPKVEQPTLDQLAGKDLTKSSSWLDLCLDTEEILLQIAEDVLQDSIEDTILDLSLESSG